MIDILHIIHADIRDTEKASKETDLRHQNYLTQCSEQGIKFKVFPGVTTERQTFHNVNLAHKQIIKYAKENNLPNVIIAESDCKFTAPGAWDYFLQQMPDSYDLWMGLIYAGEVREGRLMNGFSGGMTLYSISERFYDFVLNIPKDVHIDRELGNFCFEREYYVCQPHVVRQLGAYSYNLHRDANYAEYERDKKFYGVD